MLSSVAPLTICGAFAFGIVLALVGSLKLTLARVLHLRESQVGILLSALNLAILPMMLVAGWLVDAAGAWPAMLIGSLVAALGVFLAGISLSLVQTLGSILVVGGGAAFLSVASTVLMQAAFYPDREAASQNVGNVFFGLGALLTPTLLEAMLERLSYQRTLTILSTVVLLPGIISLLTAGSAFPAHVGGNSLGEVFHFKFVILTGLVFLLYGPLEWVLATWATTFLTDLGMTERRAAFALSTFWLSFLASRLVVAILMAGDWIHGVAEAWLIMVLSLAAGVLLGNMAGAQKAGYAAFGLILTGIALGPIFPTLVGILFEHVAENQGMAFGAMFSLGSLGGIFLPPIMGAYAAKRTLRVAWRIPIVMALLMAVISLALLTEWSL